jgi:hypothetical protein
MLLVEPHGKPAWQPTLEFFREVQDGRVPTDPFYAGWRDFDVEHATAQTLPMIGVPFTARMEGEREWAPGSGPRAAGFRVGALENQVQERVCVLVCRYSKVATVDGFGECRAVNHSAMGGFPVKRTSGEFGDHSGDSLVSYA